MTVFSATATPTDPAAWARELLQARLLGRLFTEKVHDLALKGGLALRAAYGSHRSTKDIDLDAGETMTPAHLRTHVRRAIRQATASGIITDAEVSEPKQTATVARWKISGKEPTTGAPVHLTVEVSFRDTIQPGDVSRVPYRGTAGDESSLLTVYTAPALAFKKVKAFLDPNREAPRDVVDLFLLIEAHVEPPLDLLAGWLPESGLESPARMMWDKLEAMTAARFRSDVAPYINPPAAAERMEQEWDAVRLAVGTTLEGWFAAATARSPCPRRSRP